jgi:hypothetical protein
MKRTTPLKRKSPIGRLSGSAYNRQFPNGYPKKRKPLKKQSQSLRAETLKYYAAFRAWVEKPENAQCAVCVVLYAAGEIDGINLTTERHHFRGRIRKLLNWEPGWIPCCRLHRTWMHLPENRARAEANGLISSATLFNTYPDELRRA